MRIAYFSPLPPSTSGIADYSALLLPALERLMEVDVVRPGRTRPVAGVDVALYHIGNNPDSHAWIVDALRRRRGVVVLHDFVVHHLVAGMTIGRNDGHAYLAAMEREAGVAGRMLGWGVLEGRVPPLWEVRPTEFPLVGEILDRATGVIVHSRYVEARVREHGYDGPLWRIPHPAWPDPSAAPEPLPGSPLFGCFGHVNESKRVPQLLRAFARFRETHPEARLLLVGAEAPGFDLDGRLERLGLDGSGVLREPYVEEARLWSLMAACDACVLLRAPTMGETSGSAIRTLALGKPLVVTDLGWFSELPDDVALKVPAGGEAEIDAIEAALDRLAEPGVAAAMGESARACVRTEHDLDRVAEQYAAALETTAGGATVEARIGATVAAAARDAGVPVETVAEELSGVGLLSSSGRARPLLEPSHPNVLRRVPAWFWLTALYVVAVVVQLALALRVVSPWIMVDELVYSDLARSFASTGEFLLRGSSGGYGFVYPLLISPAYALFGSVIDAYEWARVLNAFAMCSVVFPVYLLARRVVRPGYALASAALAVAVPPTIYIGTLMTENAFYPVFAWAAYALVLALERPTLRRQLVLLVLCVLAFLTRAQAVAIVAAALTAPLVLAWIERGRPRRLGAWKPLYGAVVGGGLLVVLVEIMRGKSPSDVLGGYSVTTSSGTYHLWAVLKWIVYHLASLDMALFVVPFAALVVLTANARHLDAPLRAFCAAAVPLVVWLTIQVGTFASAWSLRVEERNLFYVAPLFLIALFAWLERGQPRPSRAIVVAALVAGALPGVLPFATLMDVNAQSDTLYLQPWWYLADRVVSHENAALAPVLAAIVLAALFLWLSPRLAPALPLLVALGFFLTWLPLQAWVHSFHRLSAQAYTNGTSLPRSWIDRTVGRDASVAIVWSSPDNLYRGWENEFWNHSVRRAYDLGPDTLMAGGSEPRLTVQPATGYLLDPDGKRVRTQYVLAEPSAGVAGTQVARDDTTQMTLYRVDGYLRSLVDVDGWYPDFWTGPSAEWTRRACEPGTLRIPVRSDGTLFAGTPQRITVTGSTPAPLDVPLQPGAATTLEIPVRPSGGICKIHLRVSPTRRPSDLPSLGNPDSRRLGVLASSFSYTPSP